MITDPIVFNIKLAQWKSMKKPLRFVCDPIVQGGLGVWRAEDKTGKYVIIRLFGEYASYVLPENDDPRPLPNKKVLSLGLPLFLSVQDAVVACEDWRGRQTA